jgi:hypothetical protein
MRLFLLIFFSLIKTVVYAQHTLPIIKLTGEFGYDYQEGIVSIIYPDGSSDNNLSARIKWRGGTTNAEGKHKRNYKIKFSEDHSFFEMRNDNNWILDAGQADVFRLRNRIATELWNDFATKPYYIDQEPKALSGVRGQVVEVYLNDEYRGIYCLTECMDRKQMKLKKFDKDGTIHGVLWKSTGFGSSLMNTLPDSYDNNQPMMDVFEAKYPEPGDDLPETDYSTLWNAINFVINTNDNDFSNHVNEYFDLPVVLDYYLFINILGAIDNIGKNMYWAVYDKQKDKKITPAVWDLDLTVGCSTLGQYSEDFLSPEYPLLDPFYLVTRLKQTDYNHFNQKVSERYKELRKTYFNPDNLFSRYESYYNILKQSGAAQREEEKWSGDSDVYGHEINFEKELEYIKNWINRRILFLDKQFQYGDDTYISNTTYQSEKTIIYSLFGQRINNYNQLKNKIYIINGKKVLFSQ